MDLVLDLEPGNAALISAKLAPRKGLKRRPFLGLHPGFAVPPAFLPIGTRLPTCALALGSRGYAVADGRGALVLSIGKTRSIWRHSANPTSVRFHAFRRSPTKHTDELLLLPTFQQACPDKTRFSGSQAKAVQRLAGLPSLHSFQAEVWRSVGSFCQFRLCSSARRIPQNRAVLASAPFRAPLRSGP